MMKTLVLIFSMIILSCNSQKQVVKENKVVKEEAAVVETTKDSLVKPIEEVKVVEVKKETNNPKKVDHNQEITILTEGTHGGFKDAQTLVIKDQKGLQKIYTQINMTRRPGIPIPKIDFDKEMVVALFMGEQNSGGYSTKVESIIEKGKELEIVVKETAPEGVATTVICQPFYFCKVKRSDGQIVFKKTE